MITNKTIMALGAATLLGLSAACPATAADVQSRLRETWRAAIAATPLPAEGCFTAEYPSRTWRQVACAKAPLKPYIPRTGARAAGGQTVGNGNDYAAVAHGTVTTATGSFPVVKGLKTETGGGQANVYSLQLNSNFFFNGAACKSSSDPANCLSWEQFVYSSSSRASFIQYWLINYGNTCPTKPYNDWNSYQGSCYRNSNAVSVPQEPATSLSTIKLTGRANTTRDTFVTTIGTKAYSLGSTGRRNGRVGQPQVFVKRLGRCLPAKGFTRPCVEGQRYCLESILAVSAQVRALWKVLTQQAVGIFVRAPLPRTVWIAEVDV
jgi:hypothetical protein